MQNHDFGEDGGSVACDRASTGRKPTAGSLTRSKNTPVILIAEIHTTLRNLCNWNLMLVEQGLSIYLWHLDSSAHGYKLAADYCQHYDPRYGNGLNGPSRTKIAEIVRFMFTIEALED
jgi:hypothetical protein